MSGLRDENLVRAYRLMHARGVTTESLAAAVVTSRAYVSRVLCGIERKGRTWPRIRAHLTPEEIALLEMVPERDRPPQEPPPRRRRQEAGGRRQGAACPDLSGEVRVLPVDPTTRAFLDFRRRAVG